MLSTRQMLLLAASPAFRLAPPVMQLPPPSGMPPNGMPPNGMPGRDSASLQFMITNAMRAELLSLGYQTREIVAKWLMAGLGVLLAVVGGAVSAKGL